jgi:ribulose bisphosphate carboxylase small subunit
MPGSTDRLSENKVLDRLEACVRAKRAAYIRIDGVGALALQRPIPGSSELHL